MRARVRLQPGAGPRPLRAQWLPVAGLVGVVLAHPTRATAGQPHSEKRTAIPAISVTVSDLAFSPNGDGRQDDVLIHVDTDPSATVEVSVLDQAGGVRRTWTSTGSSDVVWDGRDGAGVVLDGIYVVRALASDSLGSVEATTSTTVDTRAPQASLVRVAPSRSTGRRRLAVRVDTADRAPALLVTLVVEDRVDVVAEAPFEVFGGRTTLRWPQRYRSGGRLYPGRYLASLIVEDDAGNVRQTGARPWRVERPMRGRVFRRLDGAGPRVALTIDDCHVDRAWRRMLGILRRMSAGATFFCPGREMLSSPRLVRRTIADGHAIGSHGWDHATLAGRPRASVVARLRADAAALWRIAQDTTAPYFRPPGGALDRTTTSTAGATAHPRVMLWDVDPRDWERPPPGEIVSTVVRKAVAGSVVLLHTLPGTATALPAIIAGLRDRGLDPVGLPEFFRAAGYR
jgi:peptidoglycan/xylan/chitin deacetylase (PgdA/CDA1 family)